MKLLLNRELQKSQSLQLKIGLVEKLKDHLFTYAEGDILEIDSIESHIIEINYIALGSHQSGIDYSPNYKAGAFEIVLFRDTQLTFILNFNTGLFGWLYLNVQPELRSKGIGTKLVKSIERFAWDIGFRRFSVEWPNMEYWIKYHQYEFDRKMRFEQEGFGYTIEMYKETS